MYITFEIIINILTIKNAFPKLSCHYQLKLESQRYSIKKVVNGFIFVSNFQSIRDTMRHCCRPFQERPAIARAKAFRSVIICTHRSNVGLHVFTI